MHIMVDLETLGTRPGSVILSIGAVKFDSKSLGKTFYTVISRGSCYDNFMTEDKETIEWWKTQSEEAQKVFTAPSVDLTVALLEFEHFIGEDAKVWGNGSDFDNVLLAEAYRLLNLPTPWKFYNNRCYRTVKSLYPHRPLIRAKGIHHNALDDAVNQASHLIQLLESPLA